MQFNEKLKFLRMKAGFTQSQLAERVFVSLDKIKKWESGKAKPRSEDLQMIAKVFETNLSEVISIEEMAEFSVNYEKRSKSHLVGAVFGFMDVLCILALILPIYSISLPDTKHVFFTYLYSIPVDVLSVKVVMIAISIVVCAYGVLQLVLVAWENIIWKYVRYVISIALNLSCVLLFLFETQFYACLIYMIAFVSKTGVYLHLTKSIFTIPEEKLGLEGKAK